MINQPRPSPFPIIEQPWDVPEAVVEADRDAVSPVQERFFLDRDDDGHWYLIPVLLRDGWQAWRELDEDDELAGTTPEGITMLGVHPNQVTFEGVVVSE